VGVTYPVGRAALPRQTPPPPPPHALLSEERGRGSRAEEGAFDHPPVRAPPARGPHSFRVVASVGAPARARQHGGQPPSCVLRMHACILRSPSKVPIPSRWSFYIVYVLVRTVGESRASGRYACLASSTVRAPSLVRYIPRSHTSSAGSSSSDYGVLLRFSWRTEGAGVQSRASELSLLVL
jgi:hypothetical protein